MYILLSITDRLNKTVVSYHTNALSLSLLSHLLVDYMGNDRAWMTEQILVNGYKIYTRKWCRKRQKIAQLIDNCSAYNSLSKWQSVEVFIFHHSALKILQPLDMGIIKCFKDTLQIFFV